MTSAAPNLEAKLYQLGPMRRLDRWLNAMPHPSLVVEITPNRVALARWGKTRGTLESYAVEPVPFGAIVPSPVEVNIAQPDAVRGALRRVFSRVTGHPIPWFAFSFFLLRRFLAAPTKRARCFDGG